jgi:uncharacterized membrane protein YfcA
VPELPDVQTLLVMAVAAVAAGIVRGFSGFGAGLIMVPVLALLLAPAVAVPIVVLLEAAAIAQLLPGALRLARWRSILPMGAAAAVTIPFGSGVLASLDPVVLRRAISVVVLGFAVLLWSGWRYRREPSSGAALAIGGLSGLLTGVAGIGGPPVILFYLSGPNPAPSTRASFICYFAITQLTALISFTGAGIMTRTVLWLGLIMAPAFLAAAYLGTRLFGRVNEAVFRRATLIFLALVAVAGLILEG